MNMTKADPEVKVARLQRKLDARNQRIAGLEKRIAKLETALALRAGDVVAVRYGELQRDLERAVTHALCNVRMIPALGIGHTSKILEVNVHDAPKAR